MLSVVAINFIIYRAIFFDYRYLMMVHRPLADRNHSRKRSILQHCLEKLLELTIKLTCQSFIVGDNQGWFIDALDDLTQCIVYLSQSLPLGFEPSHHLQYCPPRLRWPEVGPQRFIFRNQMELVVFFSIYHSFSFHLCNHSSLGRRKILLLR